MSFRNFIIDFLGGKVTDEDGNVLNTVVGRQTAEVYYKELAIQMSVNLIANAISQCTARTYENNKEVMGQNHYVLNVRPNINESSSMFWHKAVEKMVYHGEALIINVKGNLYVADSYVTNEYPMLGNSYEGVSVGTLALNKRFRQDEVVLLKLSNTNIKRLIDSLYNSYGELLEYCIERYKMDNQQKYVLELDNVKAGDMQFNKLYKATIEGQLEEFLNNPKAVLPLFKGQELKDVSKTGSISSNDFQLLIENLFKTVAQAFGIPLNLLFGKTDNVSREVNQFLTFTIEPIASMISEELSCKLYDGFIGFNRGDYVRLDTSDIQHVSILEMANAIDKLIASGVYTINEVRKLTDYDLIDEEHGDIHFITKNYSTIEDMLKANAVGTVVVESPTTEDIEVEAPKEPKESEENIQSTALNGAQIASVLEIINAVVTGQLSYEGAVTLLTNAFPFDESTARNILGNPGELKSAEDVQIETEQELNEIQEENPVVQDVQEPLEGGEEDEE